MKMHTILKGTFLAFCVICMLALPAAAAQDGQVITARQAFTGQTAAVVDDGLKEDLWNNHMEFRLKAFDLRVEHGRDIIGILQSHGCDTTDLERILSGISSKRPELESALRNMDREALRAVNEELRNLAQQFRQEMRECIREKYGTRTAAQVTAADGTSDLSGFI
jgi:hypothetical protein